MAVYLNGYAQNFSLSQIDMQKKSAKQCCLCLQRRKLRITNLCVKFLLDVVLSGPNRVKFFSLAMRKPIRLIWNHRKIAENSLRKSCDVGLRCEKSACFLRSSDAKCLRFGPSLRFGLRCERTRCRIASAGRVMRATKMWSELSYGRLIPLAAFEASAK